MTIVGTDNTFYRQITVVSTHPLPQQGWTAVQSIVDWNPPNGTAASNDVVLVCWGLLGNVQPFASTPAPTDSLLVCLGTDVGPDISTLVRVKMDSRLQNRNGVPFYFVKSYLASQGNAWPANRTPYIWAKIETARPTADFQFVVSGVQMLAFYDAAMNAYRWAGRMTAPSTPTTNGAIVHTFTPPALSLRADGRYLVFCTVRLVQRDNTRLPQLSLALRDFGTGTATNVLGQRAGVPSVTAWGFEHYGVASGQPNVARCGAWFLVDNLATGDAFELSLLWRNVVASPVAYIEVNSAELYMVHESNLGAFVAQQQTYLTGFQVHQDVSVSPINYEPLEITLAQSQDILCIATSKWKPRTGEPLNQSYQQRVSLAESPAAQGDVYAMTTDVRAGVFTHVGMKTRVPAEATRFAGYAMQNPLQTRPGVVRTTDELCMAAWAWENDPNFDPSQPPPVPIATWLTLDRESLGLGSLLALPIEPSQTHVRSLELARNELEADDGTRITWPAYLSVRRSYELIWTGMSLAQRDTLFAFLEQNRTFKWTPPDATQPVALLLSQAINSADVGARHATVTAQAVQLVWVGP